MIDYAKLAAVDFSNTEIEDFEERAAIIEHDGGYSKNEAEKQAYMAMLAERDNKGVPSPDVMRRRVEEVAKNIFRFDRDSEN